MNKRNSLLLGLLIIISLSKAQDYRCIYPNDTAYFVCLDGRITSTRVKEVEAESEYFNFYFFQEGISSKTPGSEYDICYSPYGSSWIGPKYIKTLQEHYFYTQHNIPFILNTGYPIGEEWTCFHDNEDDSVVAVITRKDTMNFLGINDSILVIHFEGYFKDQPHLNEQIEDMEIILSKNYGLIKTIGFYYFPEFENSYIPLISSGQMELVGHCRIQNSLNNLTWKEVYDFDVGDEFHTVEKTTNNFNPYINQKSSDLSVIKKVLNKEIDGIYTRYTVEKTWKREILYHEGTGTYQTARLKVTENYGPNANFDILPGEPVINNEELYTNYMIFPRVGKVNPSIYEVLFKSFGEDSCWHSVIADGCFSYETYLKGLGGPYGQCQGNLDGSTWEHKLVYYKKGDEIWGTPLDINLSTDPITVSDIPFTIQPNPVDNQLFITNNNNEGYCWVEIFNLQGNTIFSSYLGLRSTTIDISNYQPGIYFYRIFKKKKYCQEGKFIKVLK